MDLYDDEKRLAGKTNILSARVILGYQKGRKLHLKVRHFSGVKTVGKFRFDMDKTETFKIHFTVTGGQAKLILVNAFGVKTLIENTFDGEKSLFISQGITRIRMVGQAASFDLLMERLP